jgi:hypothetical protein
VLRRFVRISIGSGGIEQRTTATEAMSVEVLWTRCAHVELLLPALVSGRQNACLCPSRIGTSFIPPQKLPQWRSLSILPHSYNSVSGKQKKNELEALPTTRHFDVYTRLTTPNSFSDFTFDACCLSQALDHVLLSRRLAEFSQALTT